MTIDTSLIQCKAKFKPSPFKETENEFGSIAKLTAVGLRQHSPKLSTLTDPESLMPYG